MSQDILLDSGTNEVEILEFILGEQSFGINVAKVMQILPYDSSKLTLLPDASPTILGVIRWQERSINLIDLNTTLNRKAEKASLRPIVLVTNFNSLTNSFLIDGVNRIYRLGWDQIDPVSPFLENFSSPITGSIHIDNRDILLIDFELIISELYKGTEMDYLLEIPTSKNEQEREKIKIVFAEDSQFIRATIIKLLHGIGYKKITPFENGEDAFNYITSLKKRAETENKDITDFVNIVITDIEMPRMDGLTLCKRIKTDLVISNLPVLIFSSMINEQMIYKCKDVGADAYTTKPQTIELVKIIDGVMNIHIK